MSDDLITTFEAAQRFGVRESTMETWVRQGRIAVVRLGPKTLRLRASEVERFVSAGTVPARLKGHAALHAKLRESFQLLFLAQGRSDADASKMARLVVGENLPVDLPADLREVALLHGRVWQRFKKLFMAQGETESDAELMANVAVRD